MKIAVVSDCYLPRLGGIEVHVADLAAHLREAGYQVNVVTATAGPAEPGLIRLPPPVPLPAPINPWAGADLQRVLEGSDVVHIHLGVLAPFARLATEVALRAGKPTVLTWHSLVGDSTLGHSQSRLWREWLRAGALPTAVSSLAAAQVASALHTEHVPVLRNGIDLPWWRSQSSASPRPEESAASAEPRQIISAMRFAARKRPIAPIRILAAVRAAIPGNDPLRLTMLGDGPWLAPLRAAVARSSLRDWVDVPGRVSRQELAARYALSDLYFAPSRKEAFGIAALEARTMGLPVAAYADTGVADIIEHRVGGILATSDADMVQHMSDVLQHAAVLRGMAEHHRDHPRREHDWPAVTTAAMDTYTRVIAGVREA